MRRQTGSWPVAFCGIIAGLCVAVMLCGSVLPLATFCAPALGGLLLIPVLIECGAKAAWLTWLAVSLICALTVPDLELAFAFIFLLGYYPLLKVRLDRLRPAALRWGIKLAIWNGAITAMYGALTLIFRLEYIIEELRAYRPGMLAALLALGNLTLWVYDRALVSAARLYLVRIRPLLPKRR